MVFLTTLSALNGIPKNMKLITSTLKFEWLIVTVIKVIIEFEA
jgi:hypothetical protein